MAILFSTGFESDTINTVPAGWTVKVGTWKVSSAAVGSGTKSLANIPTGDGNVILYTGISAVADTGLQMLVKRGTTGMGGMILRSDAAYANCYTLVFSGTQATLYKRVGGGYFSLGTGTTNGTQDFGGGGVGTAGDLCYTLATVVGSTLTLRTWKNSEPMPTTPQQTWTNSDITAAGYAGFYTIAGSVMAVDDVIITDGVIAAPTTATLTGPTSGSVGLASANFTVTLSASTGSSTTITPSDGGNGGTFSPATPSIASGNTTATFTYTAASSGTKPISVTVSNGYTVTGSPISYVAQAIGTASLLTLSGNNSGAVGTPVVLTVTSDIGDSTATSITFTDSASGTFSPNPATLGIGATSTTTSFTPTTTGTHSVSIVNNRSIAMAGTPLSFNAIDTSIPPDGIYSVDSPFITWSPYNWDTLTTGTYGVSQKCMQTTCVGAYLKFRVNNTSSVSIEFDAATYTGFASNKMPILGVAIGGQTLQLIQLPTSGGVVTIATGLFPVSTVDVLVSLYGTDPSTGTRWDAANSPTNCIRIKSIRTAAGGILSLHSEQRSKRIAFLSDSIGEGINSTGTVAPQDTKPSCATHLCSALGAEYGIIAYGGVGWETSAVGGVPATPNSWLYHSGGRARSFSQPPDYLFTMLGYNGSSTSTTIQNFIIQARATVGPTTKIVLLIPPSLRSQSATTTAVANYLAANPSDNKVFVVDCTDNATPVGIGQTVYLASDGVHPTELGHARYGAAYAVKVMAATATPSVTTIPTFKRMFLNRS